MRTAWSPPLCSILTLRADSVTRQLRGTVTCGSVTTNGTRRHDDMTITGLLHVSVLVTDTARALRFYCDTLCLTADPSRPDLGYAGAWLWLGAQQLHLLELPNPAPTTGRPARGGRARHCALAVTDIAALRRRLDEAGITDTLSRSGRPALLCRDPDGNALEFGEQG